MDTFQRANPITTASTITITEMGWYCNNATEEANFEVGLYADSAGDPGARLQVDATNAKGTGAGWKKVSGLSWEISSGDYWIAVQLDDTATASNIDNESGGGMTGEEYQYIASSTTLPDPFGAATTSSNAYLAIYALYVTGGAYTIVCTAGSYAITGATLAPKHDKKIATTAGSYAVTGATLAPVHNKKIATTAGSYAITGATLAPVHNKKIACTAGVYALTGVAATLTYSGGVTAIYGDGWHMFQMMSQN
jgi:hypothetical protein